MDLFRSQPAERDGKGVILYGKYFNSALEHFKVLAADPVIIRFNSFLLGLKSEKVIWVEYNDNNLKEVLTEALVKAKDQSDVRFNFFVSPKILNYLDWIAKKRMTPRSVFLRDLIEKEMKKDEDEENI